MSERTQAAFDATGNKISEKAHEANKAIHQKHSFPTDFTSQEPTTTTSAVPSTDPLSSPSTATVSPPPLPTQPVSTTPLVPLSTTVDNTIKHAGLAAQEHAHALEQKEKYLLNKNIAGNTELPMGERAQAAFEAVGNKISEKTHETKKSYHQNQAVKTSSDVKDTL